MLLRHLLLFFIFIYITLLLPSSTFFFFNDTATTEIYTLSLHDALPICFESAARRGWRSNSSTEGNWRRSSACSAEIARSEEHTSELQSQSNLVCRLLLEKKKKTKIKIAALQI